MALYKVAKPKLYPDVKLVKHVFVPVDGHEPKQLEIPEDENFNYFYFAEAELVKGIKDYVTPGLTDYCSKQDRSWYFSVQQNKDHRPILPTPLMRELEKLTPERLHKYHIHIGDKGVPHRMEGRTYMAVMPCNGNCIEDVVLEHWRFDVQSKTAIASKNEVTVLNYINARIAEDHGYIIITADAVDEKTGRIVALMREDFRQTLEEIESFNKDKYEEFMELMERKTADFSEMDENRRKTDAKLRNILKKRGIKRDKEDLDFLKREEKD